MKRRAFLAGAAALAATPTLPAGPVGAGEWWTPELLSEAGAALDAPYYTMFANRIFVLATSGVVQFDCTNDPGKWAENAP